MKKILTALAVLAAFAFVFKNTIHAKKNEKSGQKSKKENLSSEDVIKKLTEWDKKLKTFQCNFVQTINYGDDTGVKSKSKGKIYLSKQPENLRIEHGGKQKQIIYTDKKIIWIHQPEVQVTKSYWNDWIEQYKKSFSGLVDLGSYKSMIDSHNTKVLQKKIIELVMTPKKNPKLYTLTVFIAKKDFFPKELKFTIDKITIITKLKKVKRNEKIPAEIFKFTRPEGLPFIDFTKDKT